MHEVHFLVLLEFARVLPEFLYTDQCPANEVPDGWMALDVGPESSKLFRGSVLRSKTLLWNGPMGVFEMKPF